MSDTVEHDRLSSGTAVSLATVPKPGWSSRKLSPESLIGELEHVPAISKSSSNRLFARVGGAGRACFALADDEDMAGGDSVGGRAELRRFGVFVGLYLGMRVSARSVAMVLLVVLTALAAGAVFLLVGMPNGSVCVCLSMACSP